MAIQYVFMCIYYSDTNLGKEEYEYDLEGVKHKANIYKTPTPSNRVVLFLSGSYQLTHDSYIKKLIHDITNPNNHDTNMFEKYELVVFEKFDKSSIVIYTDVAKYLIDVYINDKDGKRNCKLEELIIFGFSAGGVVASHIMSQLNDYKFKKKIITYDTPWQVMNNVSRFQKNYLYRPDILGFYIVYYIYVFHYNFNDIRHHLQISNTRLFGADKMIEMIKNVHGFTDTQMFDTTAFNFNQNPETKIVNIWCKYDPCVNRETHNEYISKHKQVCINGVTNVEKNKIGHCSDMAFDCDYLIEIMFAFLV